MVRSGGLGGLAATTLRGREGSWRVSFATAESAANLQRQPEMARTFRFL
jgi:hypothetical protein